MAATATRNSNTVYLEASTGAGTIDAVTSKNITVTGITLTSGAAAEVLTLADVTTTNNKMKVTTAANSTIYLDLSNSPIVFPNGIRVTLAQTTSFATLIVKETKI